MNWCSVAISLFLCLLVSPLSASIFQVYTL
uniref:Uncharacterized protein n=1 Tax=Siphoviridae sp. ct6bU4 TaxID=2825344 RepID=A0A8S5VAU9_9CAUD|nr:MAG TPA: hypothetical protein [Siphoviridae sp. ct6bU4]